jgi:predicted TIM-barrel fold metal-dependent hydrolase
MNLRDVWAIDQHAHNLLKPEASDARAFRRAFTESDDPAVVDHHARTSLFYRRSMRDIAELLGCDGSEEAILARREELGTEMLASRCFDASRLSAVFLDDGYLPDKILPWDAHGRFVAVKRIIRLEYLAETLIRSEDGFDAFLDHFRSRIDPPPPEVVAFKSVAAYRAGLAIQETSKDTAESCFAAIKARSRENPGSSPRLAEKPLIDFLVAQALEVSAKRAIPLQFHTGLGDPDMDLRLASPLHLRFVLENPAWRKAPIVLLHGSYPFMREAGYLASVYPRVHLDMGLAVPYLSVAGMRAMLRGLLELAPTTKLMYSSDAHMIPELFYLAAKWGRSVLADVLEESVANSDLSAREADSVAEAILRDNARALYLDEKSR